MAKEVSTPKQSGGGGYTFADNVTASFLLKMLAGIPPLDVVAGQIESVCLEKRVDGWHLDDIILTLRRLDGNASSVAISVKSNEQITKNGVPADFTTAIWEHRLHVETEKFDLDRDYLCLATPPIDVGVKSAWEWLLRKAIDADSNEFADRIATAKYDNEIGRALFQSLHCPTNVSTSQTSADTTNLLKRLRHFQFDFEHSPSDDENTFVTICLGLLRDGDPAQGLSLWTQLKQLARSLATSGGDLTRVDLADRLRATFSLYEFPNYVSDWRKLSEEATIRLERVRGRLAGKLELSLDCGVTSQPAHRVTALIGSSGSGKTVLAKNVAHEAIVFGHVIWLTSADLNLNSISEQFLALGLQHGFPELVAQSNNQNGVIVIDGLERLNQKGLENLGVLLRRAKLEAETCAWSFIFTCVVDAWERTHQAIKREYGSGLNVDVKTVEFSFETHRSSVSETFPTMARLLQRPQLATLFGNLKILDLVLSNADAETNTAGWVGESDILDWYWAQHIQVGPDGVARSRFAQKLASLEADQFIATVPIDEFGSDECRLAASLEDDQVIWCREERFGFEHDLLADWARTRFLISRKDAVDEVIRDKAFNPRWHRAIRLYGLRLLESHSHTRQRWSDLIAELSTEGNHKVESDLILESVAFAANSEPLLGGVWPQLIEKDGELLTRLLTRFLHVATLPDQRYGGLSDDVATAAVYRIPFWPLWLPVLRVLHERRSDAISLAIEQVTKISELWLKSSGKAWPLRDEAAQILLDAARHVIEKIGENSLGVDHKVYSAVFSRLLTAAVARSDEVTELAVALVERREQSLFPSNHHDNLEINGKTEDAEHDFAGLFGQRGPLSDPWPDGPIRRVNRMVHDGFLSSSNPLELLFAFQPDAAKEVLLALLIREPLPTSRYAFSSPIDEFFHVDNEHDWTPGMFFHGPFLGFLQVNYEKGIETIVDLANFVTDRWMENRDTTPSPVCATIDGNPVEYFGSNEAYYWYRDSVRSPRVVVSALMALERWLYLCLENETPIKPAVRQILKTSRSTATLGVLAAVGKKQPGLFCDELRELVPIWQFQVWEEQYRSQQLDSLLGMTMMQWSRWGKEIFNAVSDWHALDHRKTTFGDILFQQFVINSEFRSLMKSVRAEWIQELEGRSDSDETGYLERIILQFDEQNWRARTVENGVALDFVEPEDWKQRLAQARQDAERHMTVLTFPLRCRKLIDEERHLPAEELDVFWHQLRSISENAETSRNLGDEPAHAILGGIAVLTLLHESWLVSDPERDKWCTEMFVKVLNEPPPHPQFHVAESFSNYHWDNFAAMLIPPMLAEDTTHHAFRSLCAKFALAFNYSVIQDLMNAAFNHRVRLGDDFRRLQQLIFVSSGIRNVNNVTQDDNSFWRCPSVAFDVPSRFSNLIEQFALSEMSGELPSLVGIADEATDTVFAMFGEQRKISQEEPVTEVVEKRIAKRIKRGRGFEPFHIRAGFSWLENFDRATTPVEREEWIVILENLVHGFLRPLGGIEEVIFDDEDDSNFFAVPGQWDTWIFDLVATVIPQLEQEESANRLWRPILSLGLDRIHWVDSFISAWFIHGLRVEGCEKNFFREWRSMISFAWNQENWRHTAVRNHRSDGELFRHLMGFSSFGHGYIENEKYRPFVANMKSEFDKWVDTFFPHPEAIEAFANFLTFPAAGDYLRDGVRKLAEASSQFEDWHWRDFYHLDSALLKLLEHDWRINSRLINKDSEIRRHFSIILKTMCDRQIPRALELQDIMMRTNV